MSGLPDQNEVLNIADLSKSSVRRLRRSRSHRSPQDRFEALKKRVYEPGDLSIYSPKDQLLIEAADLLFYSAIRLIGSTLRWEESGFHNLDQIITNGHLPILIFWHECLFTSCSFWRDQGIVVMSSLSRDAEYIGRVVKRFGNGTSRGSSTRGGGRALVEMAECLEHGIEVAFTIDGPRGPALQAKPGAVTLARHTGHPVLPVHISTQRYFALPSWDRLQIPVPFSRCAVIMGEPIYVSAGSSPGEVALKQEAVQESLIRLRNEGEAWRDQLY